VEQVNEQANKQYYKREFWAEENLKYARPHFRMEKIARLVNRLAPQKECTLLDVGCGPATLMHLLRSHINYYGIDVAIHSPAPNLIQTDFLEHPISFCEKRFDIVVAQGVFEYAGTFQAQKFAEVRQLLGQDGLFIVSYVNFDHRNKNIYWPYNNIQSFDSFRSSLEQHFHIDRCFPTSQRWYHDEPKGRVMKALQMHMNVNIPVISRLFAVEYIFVCSHGPANPGGK
jgi:cyclopropane fatty-acyl-phospholipid synthase-like methyltransferase